MIFTYQKLLNDFKKHEKGKLDGAVSGFWYGNTLIAIGIYLLFYYFSFIVLRKAIFVYGTIFIGCIVLFIYLCTRFCGFALYKDKFMYIKYSHFRRKEKEYIDIDINSIKNIDFVKIFCFSFVKISFIDNNKLRRLYLYYSDIVMGFNVTEQKTSSMKINNRLKEIKKELDRGDF